MAAEDEIAGDAETPPPPDTDQDEDEIPPRSPSLTAGPSGVHRAESPDSPPPGPAGFKKRKQVRHLFSSSDEDDEDMKNIKRRGKKRKVETGKQQQRLRAVNVKCRVKHLNPPPLSVGARLDEAGEVISWRIVSSQQYRRTCRLWAGLDREGGQGTPLQVELRSGSESEDGGEQEEEEQEEEQEDLLHSRGGDEREPEEEAVNFSVQDEIIELLDSNDEEEYNNSQIFIAESPHEPDTDRSSPNLLSRDKDWVSISSADEISDDELVESDEQVEENYETIDDEDEIQILNESQNSLYYKITRTIKTEPIDGDDPSLLGEPSLPASSPGEFLESEREFFQDIKSTIEGADEKMVIEAYRKIKNQVGPGTDDVIQLVVQEIEDWILRKLSQDHRISQTQAKILLLDLKGENKDAFIREVDLKRAILLHKETKSLLDDIVKESGHSPEKVKEALNWLKLKKIERTKANVLSKLDEMVVVEAFIQSTVRQQHLDENIVREIVSERIKEDGKFVQAAIEELLKERVKTEKKIESIKASVGCSEELARNKLFENDGNTESASRAAEEEKILHKKSKELAKIFKTSVSAAKEKLIDAQFDEHWASQALEEENSQSEVDVDIEELLDDDEDDEVVVVEPVKEKLDNSEKLKQFDQPASSFLDTKAERKRRLKEIAESNKRRREKEPLEKVSAGIMKTSVPKNLKIMKELQNDAGPSKKQDNSSGHKRERHQSDKAITVPRKKLERRNSVGFLEEEAKQDKLKEKKEKFRETADGYKTVKKLSVHNVDYNIMSQDISKMPVPGAKPFALEGLKPIRTKGKKKLRWKDENGFEPLVDVREIEAANKGVKCGPGNKDREFGRIGNRRKPQGCGSQVIMEDVFRVILDWKSVWLDEQKNNQKPPPTVSGHFRVLPLLSTFNSMKSYVNIFIPLMIRGDLHIYLLKISIN